jgi:type IV secretion system protein VirD4
MSAASTITAVVGIAAFTGTALLGRQHPRSGTSNRDGPHFGIRRPNPPPPGRRIPPQGGVVAKGWTGAQLSTVFPVRGGKRSSARWAQPRDLRPLLFNVRPGTSSGLSPGRLVLGRLGKRTVAAERNQSVIVFGPTQSHKTSGFAVPAILDWAGPVVAVSIKTDLIDHTIEYRRSCGEVLCFDPSGSTGMVSATWSPLATSRTWPGARRTAAALTEVAKTSVGSMSDGDFWYATATKMLAPLLFAAAFGRRGMHDVIRWVDTHEESEVLDLLDASLSTFGKEDRQRSSIYTTVETILEPFADSREVVSDADCADDGANTANTATASATTPGDRSIDPAYLTNGNNTLYLCAPAHDQRRLTPLFVSVVRQIVEHVYDRVTLTHCPLDPPLLIVLDEAANIAPLSDLDALASTAAGHGVQLVTIWHDLAQITARYGPRATTVVNNHRAKLFLSGISDPSTLDYASHLIGDEEILLPATTSGGSGGISTTQSPTTRRLAPPDALRRIAPGEGVLVYGGLAPVRLRLRTWFSDQDLIARATQGDRSTDTASTR